MTSAAEAPPVVDRDPVELPRKGRVAYSLVITSRIRDRMPIREVEMVTAFLDAHGIHPEHGLPLPALLEVQADAAGQLWLLTWRFAGNDATTAPRCPHCSTCLRQEHYVTELIAPVPIVAGSAMFPIGVHLPAGRPKE